MLCFCERIIDDLDLVGLKDTKIQSEYDQPFRSP